MRPGMDVMVAYTMDAAVNGNPALIAYARVLSPAAGDDVQNWHDPDSVWWLQVYTAPGLSLPQMFPADQILGVPAIGIAEVYRPMQNSPGG